MSSLNGKVALITGAARGQGREHCLRLAKEGASIIALDVCRQIETTRNIPATSDDLRETEELVQMLGGRIMAREVDVRNIDAMSNAVAEGVGRFQDRLDVVVVNAGIVSFGMTWELSLEQWQTMIDVNLTGAWITTRVAIPHMLLAANGGSIILTSSVAGYRGYVGLAHYGSSKHGIVGLCRTLAVELGPHNIRVNTIHPNGVRTLIVALPDGAKDPDRVRPEEHPYFEHVVASALPEGMQNAEDVAGVVSWLASDESRFITGHQLPISAGNQLM